MAINPADITTIRIGQLTPSNPALSDKIAIEQGTDLFRCTLQDLINFINVNASGLQFEVKELWVNQIYIDTNFDSTGLGVNLCLGYAICNGNNGTPTVDGLVSIGYGTNYNVIGGFGGSKNAVLVEHSHTFATDNFNGSASGAEIRPSIGGAGSITTSTVGESGANKNMQPYIILLKIMKL